jgi:aminomethyltransferase
MRYSLLLDENGGILDDLIVTNVSVAGTPTFYVVVNGAMKHEDIAHLKAHLRSGVTLTYLTGHALLALQGPDAAAVLDRLFPGIATELGFMEGTSREWNGVPVGIARSGYTGEDGFELSIPAEQVHALAERLTAEPEVKPIGLGARDSLRLEAGLPLYGHDLDTATDPVSASLTFALSKKRRTAGGFAGAERIASLLADGPPQRRIGLALEGRMAAREGSIVFAGDQPVGRITSGGFAPTLGHPIAMAYVDADYTSEGTQLEAEVRGKRLAARVVKMPFVPQRYYRKGDA